MGWLSWWEHITTVDETSHTAKHKSVGLTSIPLLVCGLSKVMSKLRLSTPCTAIVTAQDLDPEAFGLTASLKWHWENFLTPIVMLTWMSPKWLLFIFSIWLTYSNCSDKIRNQKQLNRRVYLSHGLRREACIIGRSLGAWAHARAGHLQRRGRKPWMAVPSWLSPFDPAQHLGPQQSASCIQSRSLLLSSPSLERLTQRGVSMVIFNPVKWTTTMNHHSWEETRAESLSLLWQECINGISEPAPTSPWNTHFPTVPHSSFQVWVTPSFVPVAELCLLPKSFFPQS